MVSEFFIPVPQKIREHGNENDRTHDNAFPITGNV